jgi:SpoVK/Ycf46/Vps4 family AAA+-type ATPase
LVYRAWRARQVESAFDTVSATRGVVHLAAALAILGEALPEVMALAGATINAHVHAVFVAGGALSAPLAVQIFPAPAPNAHPWAAVLDEAEQRTNLLQRDASIPTGPALSRPSFLHEVTSPDVTYGDVIGLEESKADVAEAIRLMDNPALARRHGLEPIRGLLLHGPPGTGKTHFARATAGQFGKRFLEVRSSDLVSQYVGETEKNIAAAFAYARSVGPAILFIDEVDGLARSRSLAKNDWEVTRVNALLTEMDGISKDDRAPIVLAATNRLEDLDAAILRPGRFERKVHLGLPAPRDRALMLKQIIKGSTVDAGLRLDWLVAATDGMSPAAIKGLIQEVKRTIFREGQATPRAMRQADFEAALRAIAPLPGA